VLEALYVINGTRATRDQLVLRSGRGGTSGIGVTTYFEGGFVLDLGRLNDGSDFRPSSLGGESPPPTTLPSLVMPDWPVLLCLPREISTKTQEEEIEFFERTLPLAPADSFQAAYEAVFGMYAAVAEKNRLSFCHAVEAMQQSAWKAAEWRHHGPSLSQLGERLRRLGVDCCGMSSLGPLLFCLGESHVLQEVMRSQDALDCDMMITGPVASGRSMTVTPFA
jgi:beta-ribofuranosylaminobenzene 5'-phosphate synthase